MGNNPEIWEETSDRIDHIKKGIYLLPGNKDLF